MLRCENVSCTHPLLITYLCAGSDSRRQAAAAAALNQKQHATKEPGLYDGQKKSTRSLLTHTQKRVINTGLLLPHLTCRHARIRRGCCAGCRVCFFVCLLCPSLQHLTLQTMAGGGGGCVRQTGAMGNFVKPLSLARDATAPARTQRDVVHLVRGHTQKYTHKIRAYLLAAGG